MSLNPCKTYFNNCWSVILDILIFVRPDVIFYEFQTNCILKYLQCTIKRKILCYWTQVLEANSIFSIFVVEKTKTRAKRKNVGKRTETLWANFIFKYYFRFLRQFGKQLFYFLTRKQNEIVVLYFAKISTKLQYSLLAIRIEISSKILWEKKNDYPYQTILILSRLSWTWRYYGRCFLYESKKLSNREQGKSH
jgi:hypothetical protein